MIGTTQNPGETPLACHQSGDKNAAWCFRAGTLDDKRHGNIGNEHVDTAHGCCLPSRDKKHLPTAIGQGLYFKKKIRLNQTWQCPKRNEHRHIPFPLLADRKVRIWRFLSYDWIHRFWPSLSGVLLMEPIQNSAHKIMANKLDLIISNKESNNIPESTTKHWPYRNFPNILCSQSNVRTRPKNATDLRHKASTGHWWTSHPRLPTWGGCFENGNSWRIMIYPIALCPEFVNQQ